MTLRSGSCGSKSSRDTWAQPAQQLAKQRCNTHLRAASASLDLVFCAAISSAKPFSSTDIPTWENKKVNNNKRTKYDIIFEVRHRKNETAHTAQTISQIVQPLVSTAVRAIVRSFVRSFFYFFFVKKQNLYLSTLAPPLYPRKSFHLSYRRHNLNTTNRLVKRVAITLALSPEWDSTGKGREQRR